MMQALTLNYSYLYSKFSMALFHGIMFLFFFEMFGELVSSSAVLAFIASPTGENESGIPAYIITLFIPPVALLIPFGIGICLEWKPSQMIRLVLVTIFAIAFAILRFIVPFVPNPGKNIICSICVICFLIYLPFVLYRDGLTASRSAEQDGKSAGVGLGLGVILKVLFTVAGRGVNVLIYPVSGAFVITLLFAIYLIAHLSLLLIFQFSQTLLYRGVGSSRVKEEMSVVRHTKKETLERDGTITTQESEKKSQGCFS